MTGTRNELLRAIRSRVPDVEAIEVEVVPGQRPIVHITPRTDSDPDATLQRVRQLAAYVAVAGVSYVVKLREGSASLAQPDALRGPSLLASLDADPRVSGLRQAIVQLVPEVSRLVVEDGAGWVRALVADAQGDSSDDLIAAATEALDAVVPLGIRAEAAPLPKGDSRNDLDRAGFVVPRRTPRLARIARDENERFAARMHRLVAGEAESIAAVDDAAGARVLVNAGVEQGRHPASLMALYDRVFLLVSSHGGIDAFARTHGVSLEEFVAFARAARIVPVFRFDLGTYDDRIVGPIMEDPSIRFVTPRDLDYVAARYAWHHGSVGVPARALRADRRLTADLHDVRVALSARRGDVAAEALVRVIDIALANAERFEGMFFRDGHLALRHVSPGAHVLQQIAAVTELAERSDKLSLAASQMAVIDAGSATLSLALSQAFDATLFDQLPRPETIEVVARSYVGTSQAALTAGTAVPAVLEGLRIAFTPGLPVDEYLDLFDRAETQRVRALVAGVLDGIDARDELQVALRDRLAALEREVAKIRKSAVEVDLVDLLVNMSARTAPASGAAAVSTALLGMATNVAKKVGDVLIEDTSAGSFVDRLRGAVNGVSGHAIRVYRLRSALAAMRKNS